MAKHRIESAERMGSDRTSSLSAAEVCTVVRRMGYVAAKVHEVVMARLVVDDQELAERFNDIFKPLVDIMIHFTLEEPGDGEV